MTWALNHTRAEEAYWARREDEGKANRGSRRLDVRRDDKGNEKVIDKKVPSFAKLN